MSITDTPPVPINVITSTRRKKTVSARWVGNTIEVRAPEGLPSGELDRHVRVLSERLQRRRASEVVDLDKRARQLAALYDLPKPSSITWSSRQKQRWGSCTPSTGAIRISDRMSEFPDWVLDYVIVHELAHLIEANHSPAFHRLVDAFPKAERAEGFLLAVSLGHAGNIGSSPNDDPCVSIADE